MSSCDRYDCRDRELELERVVEHHLDLDAVVWALFTYGEEEGARIWLEAYARQNPANPRRLEARWLRMTAEAAELLADEEDAATAGVPEREL